MICSDLDELLGFDFEQFWCQVMLFVYRFANRVDVVQQVVALLFAFSAQLDSKVSLCTLMHSLPFIN